MAKIVIKEEIRRMFYESEKLYVTMPYIKAIIMYDFQTKKVNLLGNYLEENSVFENLIKCGCKIYLFSPVGNDIIYYDMEKGRYIHIFNLNSVSDDIDVSGRKYFETLEYDGFIYAVCRRPNMIICINPQNDDVQIFHLEKGILEEDYISEHFPVCIYDNKLVYAYSANVGLEFSLKDREFNIIYLKESNDENSCDGEKYRYVGYGMLIGSSGERWMYNLYGKLFKIVGSKKIMVELPPEVIGAYDDGMNAEQYKINRVLLIKDKLYFVLQSDYRVLVYDTHTGEFAWQENEMADWKGNRRKLGYIVCTEMDAGSYLLYSYNDWSIYVWNADIGFTGKIELLLSFESMSGNAAFDEYVRYYFFHGDDLSAYLSYVGLIGGSKNVLEEKRYGEKIYYGIGRQEI